MRCANCGNEDPRTLHDDDDTIFCSICYHRTRKDDGEDDLVLCPVCHHMRDRKAYNCMWCGSTWDSDEGFSQENYDMANEFEEEIDSSNIRYGKLKRRRE